MTSEFETISRSSAIGSGTILKTRRPTGLKLATAALLAVLLLARSAYCAETEERYWFFNHLGRGAPDLFQGQNLAILLGGTALTLAAMPFDRKVYDAFPNARETNKSSLVKAVNVWQYGFYAYGAAHIIYGWTTGSEFATQTGRAFFEADFLQAALELALKYSINRISPCGCRVPGFPPKDKSFPSGQGSWVAVANSMRFHGPAVWVPTLGMGVLAAWERVATRKHWVSDIPFGVALSFALGNAYANHHMNQAFADSRDSRSANKDSAKLSVFPILEEDARGLGLEFRL